MLPAASVQPQGVKKLATLLAQTFYEGIFSLAEIQVYLLKWKVLRMPGY